MTERKFRLTYLVGYYGFHFMAFVRDKQKWYLCSDSKTTLLDSHSDLFSYLEQNKIIPYLAFYQNLELNKENMESKKVEQNQEFNSDQCEESNIIDNDIPATTGLAMSSSIVRNSKTDIEKRQENFEKFSNIQNNNQKENSKNEELNRSKPCLITIMLY